MGGEGQLAMGDKTGIQWCDATWNPIRGCSRVSEGCRHCYAEAVAARFCGPGQPYEGLVKVAARRQIEVDAAGEPTGRARDAKEARWNGEVRFVAEHLADPLKWKKPRRIFVNSMSDLFHERLTNEQIAAVFGVMAACPQHQFIVLTKRARRMREWFEWINKSITGHWHGRWGVMFEHLQAVLGENATDAAWQRAVAHEPSPTSLGDAGCHAWPLPNVILGVSVERQAEADERITELMRTPAAVRAISAEPLLGPVDVKRWMPWVFRRGLFPNRDGKPFHLPAEGGGLGLDWVIAGCESGPGARACSTEWLRSLRDQCAEAGVAYFLKQAREHHEQPEGFLAGVRHMPGSTRKPGGIIGLPYLDGVQHAAFPEVKP